MDDRLGDNSVELTGEQTRMLDHHLMEQTRGNAWAWPYLVQIVERRKRVIKSLLRSRAQARTVSTQELRYARDLEDPLFRTAMSFNDYIEWTNGLVDRLLRDGTQEQPHQAPPPPLALLPGPPQRPLAAPPPLRQTQPMPPVPHVINNIYASNPSRYSVVQWAQPSAHQPAPARPLSAPPRLEEAARNFNPPDDADEAANSSC